MFAHYFYPLPLSIDDLPSAIDYYNTQYLVPGGEGGKHAAEGGYLRQRPLPVPPDGGAGWALENMEREVRLAIAAGITGFAVDVLDANQWDAGTQLQNIVLAAAAVDPRFEIMVMPDLAALGPDAGVVEAIVASVARSSAAYRLPDGRLGRDVIASTPVWHRSASGLPSWAISPTLASRWRLSPPSSATATIQRTPR